MFRLVTLAHYFDVYEARIVQTFLNAHGIFAVVPEWHHATQAWHHTVALQGIRVCVIDRDHAEAMALLAINTQPDSTSTDRRPTPDSKQERLFKLVAIFLWWWSGIPTPFWRRRRYWSTD